MTGRLRTPTVALTLAALAPLCGCGASSQDAASPTDHNRFMTTSAMRSVRPP